VIKQAIKGKLVSSLKVPSLNTVEATLSKKLRDAVMRTFVLDKNLEPFDPCHRARARELLKKGRAKVFKRYPFTIVLQDRVRENSVTHCHRIKIDQAAKLRVLPLFKSKLVGHQRLRNLSPRATN
jgi:hypothetical protein